MKQILVLCGALFFSLIIGEICIDLWSPQVTFNRFDERYLVDGKQSISLGYFVRDPVLPYSLAPNYQHTLVDRWWWSEPFEVSLDRYGYRNTNIDNIYYPFVFIGDSVVFGYGVNSQESLPFRLGEYLDENVYNLSIPGLGPASYIVMLNRYLSGFPAPRKIIIGFYSGNDYYNLDNSSWDGLESGQLPSENIKRVDLPLFLFEYPLWFFNTNFKNSQLFSLFFRFQAMFSEPLLSRRDRLILAHHYALKKIKQDAPFFFTPDLSINATIQKALKYAEILKDEQCIDFEIRELLETYIDELRMGNWRGVYPIVFQVMKRLDIDECSPILRDEKLSLLPLFHFYCGNVFRMYDEKKDGALFQYLNVLESLEAEGILSEYGVKLKSIMSKIESRDPGFIEEMLDVDNRLVQTIYLNSKSELNIRSKMDIFLKYLADISTSYQVDLLIVDIPGEYHLKYYSADDNWSPMGLSVCARAEQLGLDCMRLQSFINEYYIFNNSGLYLDGAHFTSRGSSIVARKIGDFFIEQQRHKEVLDQHTKEQVE